MSGSPDDPPAGPPEEVASIEVTVEKFGPQKFRYRVADVDVPAEMSDDLAAFLRRFHGRRSPGRGPAENAGPPSDRVE